ncbi:MAG TPA: hypothetical protein VMZ29_08945 [Candidatus Bathyarchaeia archaeon]|nr:hypothetical protein [Candidatus Bathyarchaeia archaeon]
MVSVGVIKVRCDACKEIIKGKYIHFSDGSIFCSECFQYLPKCQSCKKPIIGGEDNSIDGLCNLCYQRLPKCDICEKAIIGSYTRFSDRTIACDICMKKYQKCDRCGKPVVKYTLIRRKVLCKHCLTNALRCSVCNNPILGTYWIFDKENVCDYCYKIYERCNMCGIPSQFLFTVHDKKICYSCQEKAKRCSACGLPIVGRYFSYKTQEGIFCENCEHLAPHCDACGRPVGLQYLEISDGRKICNECQRSAITTEEQLAELIATAISGLADLGLKLVHDINYRLISKKLLDRRINESGAAVTAGRNLGLFQRKDDKITIYLQSHLPIQMALGTLCHELAHVWQSENSINKNQPVYIREGFCEWVSYKILQKCGYHGQAELILSRDDLYGLGFKKFLEYEKKNGLKNLIEWAKIINN